MIPVQVTRALSSVIPTTTGAVVVVTRRRKIIGKRVKPVLVHRPARTVGISQ